MSLELSKLLQNVLDSPQVESAEDEDELLNKLRFFFEDQLLLAALDLVDRDSVVRYTTLWGYVQYQVLGTTASYAVFPGTPKTNGHEHMYCTCPAFAYSVLLSDAQFMCKHLLATFLAERMSKCVERSVNPNDLASILTRQMNTT